MDAATMYPSTKLEFKDQPTLANYATLDSTSLIPELIGSSCFKAVSEDAFKDEDNARWVLELEAPIQEEWIQRLRWIRLIDRLAENTLIGLEKANFRDYYSAWQTLVETGQIATNALHKTMLTQMQSQWFTPSGQPLDRPAIQAWNQYVSAIDQYHTSNLEIQTFEQYEQMLMDLGGSFFRVFPFLPEGYQHAAGYFGVVDQFYNHLRDLHEDIQQGICYLPTELLSHFGISRDELFDQRAFLNSNYPKMMAFWLDEYLPRLRRKVRPLVAAQDLHYSWKILCFWSIHRYRRIEQVFRECEFDYRRFPHVYWNRVRADMPSLIAQVKQHHAFDEIAWPYNQLKGWKKLVFIHQSKLRSRITQAN